MARVSDGIVDLSSEASTSLTAGGSDLTGSYGIVVDFGPVAVSSSLVGSDAPLASGGLAGPVSAIGATIYGTSGDDTLYGTPLDDTIYGYAGDDILFGGNGNDTIYGGDGADTIGGGDGADNIYAGAGDDALLGGAGNDTITGGGGQRSPL